MKGKKAGAEKDDGKGFSLPRQTRRQGNTGSTYDDAPLRALRVANEAPVEEGFLSNLVGDIRNAFKPGVAVTPNMVKELEAGLARIKAGGQPTPRQQKIFDTFMSDTLPKELQKLGININEDLSQNYGNDAEAIKALMAKSARSTEETAYLTMLARKYDFYGKPENISAAIAKAEKSAAQDTAKAAAVDGDPATAKPRGPLEPNGANANYPSMAAAMQKIDYWQPGEKVNIDGRLHVRDITDDGKKIYRPVDSDDSPAMIDRIKSLAGLD